MRAPSFRCEVLGAFGDVDQVHVSPIASSGFRGSERAVAANRRLDPARYVAPAIPVNAPSIALLLRRLLGLALAVCARTREHMLPTLLPPSRQKERQGQEAALQHRYSDITVDPMKEVWYHS